VRRKGSNAGPLQERQADARTVGEKCRAVSSSAGAAVTSLRTQLGDPSGL
jgi:hypothetical protein